MQSVTCSLQSAVCSLQMLDTGRSIIDSVPWLAVTPAITYRLMVVGDTGPLIYISLNHRGAYCVMIRSSMSMRSRP